MNARRRIYDVPAARRWAELRRDADDLRWATSIAREHGAPDALLQDLTALADQVAVSAEGQRQIAHRDGGRRVARPTWRERVASRVNAWAARGRRS